MTHHLARDDLPWNHMSRYPPYPTGVPEGMDPDAYRRLTEDGFEIYATTAEGVARLLQAETRPKQRREILVHVRALRRDGLIPEQDYALLARRYPKLGP